LKVRKDSEMQFGRNKLIILINKEYCMIRYFELSFFYIYFLSKLKLNQTKISIFAKYLKIFHFYIWMSLGVNIQSWVRLAPFKPLYIYNRCYLYYYVKFYIKNLLKKISRHVFKFVKNN
jgi:hypothetical protein